MDDTTQRLPAAAKTKPLHKPTQQRNTLLRATVAALLAVAALPFGLAAFQIYQARESMVNQAQQTHLIAARATADRIDNELQSLINAAQASAENPLLYEDPQSDASRETLAGLLIGRSRIKLAATLFGQAEATQLIQMARAPGLDPPDLDLLDQLGMRPTLLEVDRAPYVGLARETGRPGLRIALLADAQPLLAALQPRELGSSAELYLLDGTRIERAGGSGSALPEALLAAIRTAQIDAQAVRTEVDGVLTVGAFARLGDSGRVVASLQPAADAEAAAARMRRAALIALAAVGLMVAGLSLLAWRKVLQPLRGLLSLQRSVLPMSAGSGSGSDLADLQATFKQIQRYQRNREAMKEVFLGRYKLLSTLGQGAMGSVFLAWDPRLKRHVAIKTIHLDSVDSAMQAALARTLENEAVAVANLQHPNIVAVYDLVAAGEFAFVVMEYVEGGNLRSVVSRNGALEASEVALIAQLMLKALDTAHRAGLLHLDIKPGNVLISPQGELKLTDFGVSAWRFEIPDLVARGGLAGTPGFIAPEYVNGAAPSERSDLFSLGKLLVECLTGAAQHLPGANTGDMQRAAQVPSFIPERVLKQQPELCQAILALCALDPLKRPSSAAESLRVFAQLNTEGAEDLLAKRAQALGDEQQAFEAEAAATSAPPGGAGTTTRPLPSGRASSTAATLPPPGLSAGVSGDATTRPPPAAADAVTRPPPGQIRPSEQQRDGRDDTTRPPPTAKSGQPGGAA
ncbi:serine/threonine-protein kinase [Pseudomarimonas arenosa]|uniref:Protein kinase n=1 Tax=Pseudomarimonas arenosa TaxID=2774145 RepID=A0AAW3ZJZ7_9GAMM|nr:serine/threonine-protein kinase [Pseudomarimonas arenosa]MBD8525534.1 protein kinase [Pseudomarimonas arenosa]